MEPGKLPYRCRNCSEKQASKFVLHKAKYFSFIYCDMKTDNAIFRSLCKFLRHHKIEFQRHPGQVKIEGFIIAIINGRIKLYSPFIEKHTVIADFAICDLHTTYVKLQKLSTVIIKLYRPNDTYKPLPEIPALLLLF